MDVQQELSRRENDINRRTIPAFFLNGIKNLKSGGSGTTSQWSWNNINVLYLLNNLQIKNCTVVGKEAKPEKKGLVFQIFMPYTREPEDWKTADTSLQLRHPELLERSRLRRMSSLELYILDADRNFSILLPEMAELWE